MKRRKQLAEAAFSRNATCLRTRIFGIDNFPQSPRETSLLNNDKQLYMGSHFLGTS